MIASSKRLEPGTARRVERVLAIGYAEARRRKQHRSKLEALLEATVAVCDMFPPAALNPEQFYLSDIQLDCRLGAQQHEIASSLAEFDAELRAQLEKWFGRRQYFELEGNLALWVPYSAAPAIEPIQSLWSDCLHESGFDPAAESCNEHRQPRVESVASEFTDQVNHALRFAFDAVTRESPHSTFTLRVNRRPDIKFKVADSYSVNYSMGYWLSTGMLRYLQDKKQLTPGEIVLLERLQEPVPPTAKLCTQSHTNVETRLAGIVRNQGMRSSWIKKLSGSITSKEFTTVETKAWGTPPESIFMMPLSNYDLGGSDTPPRILAHSYDPIEEPHNVFDLLAKRYRLSLIFSESFYEEYCRILAHELAARILDGSSAASIEQHCEKIAKAFGAAKPFDLQMMSSAERHHLSLAQKLTDLKEKKLLAFTERELGPRYWSLLGNFSIEWRIARQELDVLLHFVSQMALLAAKEESGVRVARRILQREYSNMQQAVFTIQNNLHNLQNDLIGQDQVSLADLLVLSSFFNDKGGRCACEQAPLPYDDKWSFRVAHQYCDKRPCKNELNRRVGFLFGGEPTSDENQPVSWVENPKGKTQQDLLREICAQTGFNLWEVLKYACQNLKSTKERPTLSSIVILALIKNGKLTVEKEKFLSDFKKRPSLTHIDWQTSLGGILSLAKWERPLGDYGPAKEDAEIVLDWNSQAIFFTLVGPQLCYKAWMFSETNDLRQGDDGSSTHSRKLQIAAAYGQSSPEAPPRGKGIEKEPYGEDGVRWKWSLDK
jgi:hypothetical protein